MLRKDSVGWRRDLTTTRNIKLQQPDAELAGDPAAQGEKIKNGRYWIRTSDPFRVKEVRYRCANRPMPKDSMKSFMA